MKKPATKHECPLCGSMLTEMKFYKIVGVWDAKAKAEQAVRKKLQDAEKQQQQMIAKQKSILKQLEKEKKAAIKDGIERGKQKETARANRLSIMVQKQTNDLQVAAKKIKELETNLKNGTTPQRDGIDFEVELIKQLKKVFPTDKIAGTPGGRGGDIFHEVVFKNKVVGSILYECKKTAKFSGDYIHQTKKAIAQRNATFGVLVSFVSKKDAQGFYVENDIMVVHPFGASHIAQVLRNSILELHSMKLGHKELESRSQNLMEFIKSDDFKNSVDNTIYRTRELARILENEFKEHRKAWKNRAEHYSGININANQLRLSTKHILNGTSVNKNLLKSEIKQLVLPAFIS